MDKGKGFFKKIVAGALSFTMLCGMVIPTFAAENEKSKVEDIKVSVDEKDKKDKVDKIELDGKIKELNNKIEELDKDLEDQKAESKIEKEALEKEISKVNEKLDAEIAEKESLKKELSDEKKYSENERKKLAERIVKLENDVYALKQAKEKLEKNLEKLNEDMNSKIEELQKKITQLSEEKDRNELNNMNLPEDVKVGQWYPEKVIEYPSKKRYDDGDTIKLDGMKMAFRRVVKENGHYKAEIVEVSYDDMKHGYKGWNLDLKTKTAKYDASTNGKMKIRFTMKLAETEKSMK